MLALVAAHYVHTAPDHAKEVLKTCGTLAAGLGAQPQIKSADKDKKEKAIAAGGGSPALRLWVGERFLELYKRAGQAEKAEKQRRANLVVEEEVRRLVRSNEDLA